MSGSLIVERTIPVNTRSKSAAERHDAGELARDEPGDVVVELVGAQPVQHEQAVARPVDLEVVGDPLRGSRGHEPDGHGRPVDVADDDPRVLPPPRVRRGQRIDADRARGHGRGVADGHRRRQRPIISAAMSWLTSESPVRSRTTRMRSTNSA